MQVLILLNQIPDKINWTDPHSIGQLDHYTWLHYNSLPFLEDINITETIQKGDEGVRWYAGGDTVISNTPRNLPNFYEYI